MESLKFIYSIQINFLCYLSSFQNTLPKGSSTEDETQPLITVSGGNITNYSSSGGVGGGGGGGGGGDGDGGNIQYDHERSGDYDDKLFSSTEEEREANHNGRYTPVSNIFSATTEVRPKTAWQLPHKDYDVRGSGP